MEGEKKGRREKKEGEKERRGNERMEGVDRGWIKEGNFSLRGSSGGGIRLLGTDRPTFRSLLAGKSSRRREERLIKLMQKYTSQGTEGKY